MWSGQVGKKKKDEGPKRGVGLGGGINAYNMA